MPNNIEIKARIEDRAPVLERIRSLADQGPFEIAQDDTFFACPNGRLKLREFGDGGAQLIFYQREDITGPKNSSYSIVPVTEPDALREGLALAYGLAGRVIKHRTLYLSGRTRIHLDRVQGLGDFLELEIVLAEGESIDSGLEEAHQLQCALGISDDALLAGAYVDLLAAQTIQASRA